MAHRSRKRSRRGAGRLHTKGCDRRRGSQDLAASQSRGLLPLGAEQLGEQEKAQPLARRARAAEPCGQSRSFARPVGLRTRPKASSRPPGVSPQERTGAGGYRAAGRALLVKTTILDAMRDEALFGKWFK